jgi:hypothetical protein
MTQKKVEIVRRGVSSLAVQRWRKLLWAAWMRRLEELDQLLHEKVVAADEVRNRSDLMAMVSHHRYETLEDVEVSGRNHTLRSISTRLEYLVWGGSSSQLANELVEHTTSLLQVFFEEQDLDDMDDSEADAVFEEARPSLEWLGVPPC